MKHIILGAAVMLSGCGYFDHVADVCFDKATHFNSFIEELDNRDIEHGITKSNSNSEGMICTSVKGLSIPEYTEIKDKLFGQQPPEKFSLAWPIKTWAIVDGVKHPIDKSSRILKGLKVRKIETRIVTYYDLEFLVWEEKDDQIVRAIIENRI